MGVKPLLLSSLLWAASTTTATAASPSTTQNANHIFNSIHSSMRQWGSSLQHNGMSLFLASVPAGTQFYHGTSIPDPINGTEWLAFEPEHAMVFARAHMGPHPGEDDDDKKRKELRKRDEETEEEKSSGWLHTYVAAKDLRLLYADGMSAGKTHNGTLDFEDRVLFRDEVGEKEMMGDRERANMFCRMAKEEWDDRVDGMLRMEAGFEIILCDFARDLKEVRVTRTKPSYPFGGPGGGGKDDKKKKGGPVSKGDGALWFKAIAARYDGIGGNRVTLNYDNFVSAYTYGLDLFHSVNETFTLPRLTQFTSQQLIPIREALNELVMQHEAKEATLNWQTVTDMVVERYAHDIRYFASGQLSTVEEIHAKIEKVLGPFVDYEDRDGEEEAERCSMQFIPGGAFSGDGDAGVAATAVHAVTRRICETMVQGWQETDYSTLIGLFQDLMEYLAWTTWKQCSGCADHEICVVPIWPMGTVEDYNHPQCRDATKPESEGQSYWGGRPGGPGGHHPPPSDSSSSAGWIPSLVSFLRSFLGVALGLHF
ncbi:uncharacterized protein BO87DRAFT_131117 [Aspergillus neoniger CBS 115656]|uniref:Uncharacterized protein n=1 Tax=Aspergillus neoniger (strain CBS 115656) TaxID=1448310 RepID=A0A318YW40_ASPNB|nr:hypothetical protein BO87DRAFT_131117 [Aspergillus neoniger CBS 115656]PYH38669.1 hypothetical protein BO87DRAFT_131117 [Aspergillus neoniger CBS 115656]